MNNCFICNSKALVEGKMLLVTCKCPKCGSFAYEKNFVTAYNYYCSTNPNNKKKIDSVMKKYIKKTKTCFIDDFDTSIVEGYTLLEFRDILNMAGFELATDTTIDSNWKD